MPKKVSIELRDKHAVTPAEAAAMLSTGTDTIKNLMKAGILPYMKIGTDFKIWVSDLEGLREKLRYKQVDTKTFEITNINYKEVV